ncbi:uncharacterized protein LOC132316486 [Cornus florida]|uniref:uncharacterized protein LOC132316486 n=1 Tax=Cornus florida TaxID=4283 RepID=UPI00289B6D0C|nr:uncharacterized protein LOC132316486 [Cornus florida]
MSNGGSSMDQQTELMQKMREEFLRQFDVLRQANEASVAQIALLQQQNNTLQTTMAQLAPPPPVGDIAAPSNQNIPPMTELPPNGARPNEAQPNEVQQQRRARFEAAASDNIPRRMQDEQVESSHKLTVWSNGIPDGAGVQDAFDEKRLLKIQTPAEMAREHKNSLVKTPFTDDVYLVERPKKFTMPSFTQFDGTGDPSRQLDHYAQKMALDDRNDPWMCRVFPTSLIGAALEWFKNRPHKSIPDYVTPCTMFLAQYCGNKKQKKSIASLFTIRQKKGETLQDFLSRFNMEALEIADCHPATAIETFKLAMIQGTKFYTSLVKYSPPDMQNLNTRAKIYIRLEENIAHRAQHATLMTVENKPRERIPASKIQKSQRSLTPITQAPEKRQRVEEGFTPLRTTLARFFQEKKMKFTTPQPIKQPLEQRDKSKHCAYHRDYGHSTNDCRSFRRQVENMIARGELADYLMTKEYAKPREVYPRKVEGTQLKVIHAIHGRSEDDQESDGVYGFRLRAAHKLRKISSVNVIASGSISIRFEDGDLSKVQLPYEDPLVISLLVANCMIKRVLIDPGSSANIIIKTVFEQLKIPSSSIRPTSSPLMGFDGTRVDPLGVIDLSVTAAKRTLKENFVLIEIHLSYNLIMGRGWIHRMRGVSSTLHQVMRYLSPDGKEVINL